MGVPTLDGLGAWGDGAHAVNEHILIDQYAVSYTHLDVYKRQVRGGRAGKGRRKPV